MKNRNRTLFGVALASVAALSAAQLSNAAVLFSTGFSTPTYTDGALNTNTDTTTPGQDGWLNTSGGGTNNIAVSNSATNGLVSLTTSGQDVRHPLAIPSGFALNSGSVYFSADINVSAAQSGGDYALSLGDGGASLFYARTYIKSSGTGYVMALGTSSGTATYGTTVLPFGTVEHVLVRYDFVSGTGNDTGALFLNPTTTDGSGDSAYVAATTVGTDASSIAGVYLRQGAAGSAATLTVDNISVSGTPTATPEPASLALLGLGAVALTGRRRRA